MPLSIVFFLLRKENKLLTSRSRSRTDIILIIRAHLIMPTSLYSLFARSSSSHHTLAFPRRRRERERVRTLARSRPRHHLFSILGDRFSPTRLSIYMGEEPQTTRIPDEGETNKQQLRTRQTKKFIGFGKITQRKVGEEYVLKLFCLLNRLHCRFDQ